MNKHKEREKKKEGSNFSGSNKTLVGRKEDISGKKISVALFLFLQQLLVGGRKKLERGGKKKKIKVIPTIRFAYPISLSLPYVFMLYCTVHK